MGSSLWRRSQHPPRRLSALFGRSETDLGPLLIRPTAAGTWVPTPLAALQRAIACLDELGRLEPRSHGLVIDAGTGDGRLAALLGWERPAWDIYGVEADPTLTTHAVRNLSAFAARRRPGAGRLEAVEADYCDLATYTGRGLDPADISWVFNYPDGSQERLARLLAARGGPDTRLCLFTHNQALTVAALRPLESHQIEVPESAPWRLSIYGTR